MKSERRLPMANKKEGIVQVQVIDGWVISGRGSGTGSEVTHETWNNFIARLAKWLGLGGPTSQLLPGLELVPELHVLLPLVRLHDF
jgi:hypothetical protein